jgi:hypothetical protein
MRYNPIEKEWDLHYLFDADAPAPDEDDIDNDDEYFHPNPDSAPTLNALPIPAAVESSQPESILRTFGIDMESTYGGSENPLHPAMLAVFSTLDTLRNRHGFVLNGTSPPPSSFQSTSRSKLENILLGHDLPQEDDAFNTIVAVVSLMASRQYEALGQLWDLSSACSNKLTLGASLLYTRIHPQESSHPHDKFLVGGRFSELPHWLPAVDDAVVVLECCRRFHDHSTTADLVSHFVRTGVPFRRIVSATADIPSVPDPAPLHPFYHRIPQPFLADENKNCLGFRWPGYQPEYADYISYWTKVCDFLRGPRGHLAIAMGGVVWRLSIHALGLEQACDRVLTGRPFFFFFLNPCLFNCNR